MKGDGLATELFCGAGGLGQGVHAAGIDVKYGLNHDRNAVLVYGHNYPKTTVEQTDITNTNPSDYRRTQILVGGPACDGYTDADSKNSESLEREWQPSLWEIQSEKAKQLEVAKKQKRVTMYDIVRFCEVHHYDAGFIENVIQVNKWRLFSLWCQDMRNLGYELIFHNWNSMFFHEVNGITGLPFAPQSRDRWYCTFYKKGMKPPDMEFNPLAWCPQCELDVYAKQTWKNKRKLWGRYNQSYYYACPKCWQGVGKKRQPQIVEPYFFPGIHAIDWRIPFRKIGDPTREKPISQATKERVKQAMALYGPQPMMHGNNGKIINGNRRLPTRSALLHPLYTQTRNQEMKLSVPFLSDLAYGGKDFFSGLTTPSTTQTRQQTIAVALIELFNGGTHRDPLGKPFNTVTKVPTTGIAFTTYNNNSIIGKVTDHPLPTITRIDRVALAKWKLDKIPNVDDVEYRTLSAKYELPNGEIISEVTRVMGFQDDFDITGGLGKKMAARTITALAGGAVTPIVGNFALSRIKEIL